MSRFIGVCCVLCYLDPKKPYAYESSSSAYLMRRAGNGHFNVPEAEGLGEHEVVYKALLEVLLVLFQEVIGVPVVSFPSGDVFHGSPQRRSSSTFTR